MYKNREKEKTKRKQKALNITAILLACVCIYSVTRLILDEMQYRQGRGSYEDLNQYMTVRQDGEPDDQENDIDISGLDGDMSEVEIGKYIRLQELGANFSALRSINGDVVGWIEIPGTELNYPVVQCSNNDYYLNHLFTEEYNICGCPFLDYRNPDSFDSRNNVIYGHRMNDGSMFTCIQNYSSQSFYEYNPRAILYTPDGAYSVEFFSGYVTAAKGDPWKLSFSSDQQYLDWLNSLAGRSDFSADISFSASDRVLTLSTCSHAFENARYVLHGVLREM